jgi:hypothetical protein
MSRAAQARIAVAALVGLTAASWWLTEDGASAWVLAGLSLLKVAVVGAVFLELLRSWPGWAAISMVLVALVLGLSAVFVG